MQIDYETVLNELENIANAGYFEVDLSTGNWICSENILRILGFAPKEVYSIEELRKIVHPDDLDGAALYLNRCLEKEKRFDYKYRCILPNGKIISVITKSKIIRDENNKPVKLIGITQDITSIKLKESRLSELIELNKRKNEILGTVSHDFKITAFLNIRDE